MRRLLFALMLISAALPATAATFDNSAWPMMRGNPQQNSTTTLTGLTFPKVSWRYSDNALNPRRNMGTILGSDGTLYIGGRSLFVALNPDGTLKWTANQTPSGTDSWGHPAVGDNGLVYISSIASVYAYAAAGSGNVTFVSSAPAGSPGVGGKPGGGGAVMISTSGYVWVGHGDQTQDPPLDAANMNVYSYTPTLVSSITYQGTIGTAYRSGPYFTSDFARVCVAVGNWYLQCRNPNNGVASNITVSENFFDFSGGNFGASFRHDGSWVTAINNSSSQCPAQNTSYKHIAAVSDAGTVLWRKCDLDLNPSGGLRMHAPVSDSSLNTYLGIVRNSAVSGARVLKVDNTGATVWTHTPGQPGAPYVANTLGPLTLAAGATVYFSYCAGTGPPQCSGTGTCTRLAALDALSGSLNWDVLVSTNVCNSGQVVPAPGNRMYLHNGTQVLAFENSEATAMSVSSSASTADGLTAIWATTATVSVTGAGAIPVSSGVIVEVTQFDKFPASVASADITPGATSFLLTDAAGTASFPVRMTVGGLTTAAEYQSVLSTIVFRTPGLPDKVYTLRESRPASVQVSSTTPIFLGAPGSFVWRVSTMTFTVRDSLSAPVSGIPCVSRAAAGGPSSNFPGSNNMYTNPVQAFWPTDGTGQASVAFMDNFNSLPSSNASYSVYAVTHTVACLGMPPQQFVMKEDRVASVTYSTGAATMVGTVRTSNVIVTLRDTLSNPVPGVPVALKPVTSPASVSVTPTAVNFTTATDSSGQAYFQVQEDINGVDPSLFSSMVSTLTLHILSNPSVPLYLREERIGSVSLSTSPASFVGGSRVVTATVTVQNLSGGALSGIPIGLKTLNYAAITGISPANGSNGLAVTDGSGLAVFTITQNVLSESFRSNYGFTQYANFNASVTAHAPYKPALTSGLRETRAVSFTVSVSSPVIQSDVRYATITVTVRDGASAPLSGVPVGVSSFTRVEVGANWRLAMHPPIGGTGNYASAVTDASGRAGFSLLLTANSDTDYDDFDEFTSTVNFAVLNVGYATSYFLVESNKLDNYAMTVPTYTSVGVAFSSTITARNLYNHKLSSYTESAINLTPLFAGSAVQGTGTLGTTQTNAFTNGTFVIPDQTYNKVELIEIKAQRSSDGKSGRSNPLDVQGPAAFRVHVPTSATAGNPFSMTVEAISASGVRVIGYSATLSLSALQAGNTSQAGAGILGTTNVNLPGNGIVTIANQTYTKSESIKIRASDSGSSIVGTSTDTVAMRAGTPTSMTLSANPQSTIATVPSVLSSVVQDVYGNKVAGATVTYSVLNGSGVVSLSLSGGAVVSAVTSTNAVTDANGSAGAFFGSTNTLSSQANLLRVSLGALTADTTIYNAVLITSAGGAIVNLADPRIRVDCPANAWSFPIRMSAQSRSELSAADLALTTAAFAAQTNVFVSTVVAKLTAVRDSNPNLSAGVSPTKVSLSLPVEVDGSSQVTVGSYRGQSILVPLSVLRVFKLNQATSLFEMVLDGTNLADLSSRTVTAQLSDPNGIYALGAPPFTTLSAGSSGTVTAVLAAGATATIEVPFGAFSAATNLQVGVPSAASVPSLPANRGMTGTGLTISIQTTNSLQPVRPVTVIIGYRAQDVLGINPDHLRLARYDESTGWIVLDSSVDTITRKVTGETDHFSLFQIVAVAPHADLSSGIVFPNPFRPNAGHARLKFGQLPALAKIRIFTVSGRMLKQLETDATGQVLGWDAKDKDGNALPSGVYLALIESGNSRKTLKFAIQR